MAVTAVVRLSKKRNMKDMPDKRAVADQAPRLEDLNPATSPVPIAAPLLERALVKVPDARRTDKVPDARRTDKVPDARRTDKG
jgi:hypothetical protein